MCHIKQLRSIFCFSISWTFLHISLMSFLNIWHNAPVKSPGLRFYGEFCFFLNKIHPFNRNWTILMFNLFLVIMGSCIWQRICDLHPYCHSYCHSESESHSVMSDSLWSDGLYSPWYSTGQNIGVGSLSLLQGIFPTQGLNPGLLHCRQILYQLSHKWSPLIAILLFITIPYYPFNSHKICSDCVCVCVCVSHSVMFAFATPVDHRSPSSSVHGILQARVLSG